MAKDVWPGSRLDVLIFELICLADYFDQFLKDGKKGKLHDEHLGEMRDIGFHFTKIIKHGKTDALRQMADAVDQWHAHQRSPDKIRVEILRFCIPFPEGKAYAVRDIVTHLQTKKLVPPNLDHDSYQNWRTKISRICKETGIRISGKAGNPQLGRERKKKAS